MTTTWASKCWEIVSSPENSLTKWGHRKFTLHWICWSKRRSSSNSFHLASSSNISSGRIASSCNSYKSSGIFAVMHPSWRLEGQILIQENYWKPLNQVLSLQMMSTKSCKNSRKWKDLFFWTIFGWCGSHNNL